MTARATAVICITIRRPPGMRSTVGPMAGATTANGAALTSRYSSTFDRCASGVRLSSTEPASAPYIAASPTAMNACVRASRWNFETGVRWVPVAGLTTAS